MMALVTALASSGFFANADLVTAYVAIGTAASTGLWGIKKYADARNDSRRQELELAERELEQRRNEALHARQQRAAELIKAVGETTDPTARRWVMSALSLYPEEALDLLLTALGEASSQEASAIKLSVITLGRTALDKTVHYNRVAAQICAIGDEPAGSANSTADARRADVAAASRMRDRTREILLHLLLQIDEDQRANADLVEADLTSVNLAHARLTRTRFRKAVLDRAIFSRAALGHANLRGASLEGTVFTKATLTSADLTGARGAIHAIGADCANACFDHAQLAQSHLDGARLQGASFKRAVLSGASLAGARLSGVTLENTQLIRANLQHVSATSHLTATSANLSYANLSGARIPHSTFDGSALVRITAHYIDASGAKLTNTDLNGADLTQSHLPESELRDCLIGGAVMRQINLEGATIANCRLASTDLSSAHLAHTTFDACTFVGKVDFRGADLTATAFKRCIFQKGAALLVDNDSWKGATFDETARDAFQITHEASKPVEQE
ncbi:Uncharacterized protein YjbI, contains pentapeptide repeats [Actinopolymorpha cephalotaxi]|uniref:Uncharacterized protein YjbI with pentapeptide repeats n=1 Tax=Actinopolymorpha cephalotaxi TaxID=504797 RepID=A0A1I3CGC6_9ACTN|nr:pentapeptide repeat-containing protein [Actinopolymorpha cephalotaxi]NYH83980.1 uncharacterized protein YjbI with pentapeptide repeats [Actinopolymorpha cephalotaxi]SFH73406.1 Uncharacterized protein YjbI, contains pentapeptide repeats [Actinopolymorpha cephalotaxi]